MYLDYDTAPAHIKARLVRASSMCVKDRRILFYRKAYCFLRVCSTAITYGGVAGKDEEVLKENYNYLVKSGLENILKSYFNKESYEKLMKVIKNLKD